MSRLVKNQSAYFRVFTSTTSNKQRQALLDTITRDQLRAFTQIVVNFLQRTFTVPASSLTSLKSHRRFLRHIGDTTLTFRAKRNLLRRKAVAVTEFLKAVEPALQAYLK